MARWLYVGAAAFGLLVLGAVASAPTLHDPGHADCPALLEDPSDPSHGTLESAMYAERDGTTAAAAGSVGDGVDDSTGDCPVDDGAAMGSPAAVDVD